MLRAGVFSIRGAARSVDGLLWSGAASRFSTAAAAVSADASLPARMSPTLAVRKGSRVAVVLREQLDNLGYRGEEVKVAPGYARNFLIPKGKAVYATRDNRDKFKVVLPDEESKAIAAEREFNMLKQRITAVRLSFSRSTIDGVRLYGSITPADIAEALQNSVLRKLKIKEKNIRMPGAAAEEAAGAAAGAEEGKKEKEEASKPIKTVGEHRIEIEARPGAWVPLFLDISSS